MNSLSAIDLGIICLYFLGMLAIGVYFSRRSKSTEDYFVGGRAYPGWVLGLSMMSTTISSVTFLAFPAAAFALDWRMAINYLTWPVGMVVAVLFFIPFVRGSGMTTIFDYLDRRFGTLACIYGVALFLLSEFIRLGIVLYIVGVAIHSLTGFSLAWVIVVLGGTIAAYTVIGGFEGVVWTDVVQAGVLWLGGFFCIGLVLAKLGWRDAFQTAWDNGKFSVGPMGFNLSERTFWTMMILGVIASVGNFTTSQHVIQRYQAARNLREARRGAVVGALTSMPTWLLFFLIGTLLWSFYHLHPDPALAGAAAEQVFPHFIRTQFPAGVKGLVLAGVFAAAMSSLDSSINAISTVAVTNLFRRFQPGRPEAHYLRLAHLVGVACGAWMILCALGFTRMHSQESVIDMQTTIFSVVGGAFFGIFLCGFLSTRIHYQATVVAIVLCFLLNLYLGANSLGWLPKAVAIPVHSYWTGTIVNLAFCLFAWGISFLWPRPQQPLDGLTVWSGKGK